MLFTKIEQWFHPSAALQKNGGLSVCKNAILSQNLQILCENCHTIVKILKMRAKRGKICNLYVKFDTKLEKRGHWVKKGGHWVYDRRKQGGLLTGTWSPFF